MAETTEKTMPRTNGAPTRTLEKGLLLLGLFDVEKPEWSLRELREHTGLSKPTARRLIKTLESGHWVAYDADSGQYHLGSSALKAGYLAISESELVRVAHPLLVRLEEETTETASFSVWIGQGALILDTVPTSRPFKPYTIAGMVLPGVSSADAQALIAFMPEDVWESLLSAPIEARTEYTVTDPETLRERWHTVRREGVALDWEEWKVGAPACAAPVFDGTGRLRGTISVVPAIERCSQEQMRGYAEAAKRTAADMSKKLG